MAVDNGGLSPSEILSPTNTLLLRGEDLDAGVKTGVVYEDGSLTLAGDELTGRLESGDIPLPRFTDLVATWNSNTPAGAFVELSVKVRRDGAWSRWFTYGKWSDNGTNIGSVKGQKDDVARLDIDLLRILADEGVVARADAVRFRLELTRESAELPSPRVRLIGFTWAPADADSSGSGSGFADGSEEIALNVAPRAQLPVPEIGRSICSPTSVATVMAHHGHFEDTVEAAAGARDNGAGIYGNWSYNVAYAAEKGFTAWVQRCDSMEDVAQYLLRGLPVIASIRTTAKEDLEGALSPYRSGHLLVITGLTRVDGQDYVLVNDPAAHKDEDVPRRYRLDQFLKAWTRKMVYVVKPEPASGTGGQKQAG